MTDCLTCDELEAKICTLAEEIQAASCGGLIVREGDTQFDHSPEIKAKIEVLKVYRELHASKCKGSGDLYEFVQIPCVKPHTCEGAGCLTVPRIRTSRRYRR